MSTLHSLADQAIADQAGYWDAHLRSPACTEADRAKFADWRDADPAHRAAFEKLQSFSATLSGALNRADVRGLRDSAIAAVNRQRRLRAWAAAACLVLLIGGIAVQAPFRSWVSRADHTERYTTQTGQRSTVTLRDGSSIELNARSLVEVRFSETRRDVKLVAGQALFHVAKNRARPFVVRAGDREIVAVGTAFDVRLDNSSVRVTLLEGQVNIDRDILKPGQQLIAALSRPDTAASANRVLEVNVSKATSWLEGRVFLDDLPLAEAVAEMNRYSMRQIVVQGEALASLRVNGMFRAGEQEAFVAALETYFPLVAEEQGDSQIILSPKR